MRSRRLLRAVAIALAVGLGVLWASDPAAAKVFASRKEAIASAFPEADRVDERTYVLNDGQAEAVEGKARSRLESRLITIHTGYRGDELLGHAWIDVHTVRTLPEAFMVVVTPDGAVRSLRVLAFYEPQEYLPPKRWLAQFEQERLGPQLRLRGKIHTIAGSTLSSRAVTGGVRRALALWEVLLAPSAPALAEEPARDPGAAGR